MIDDGIQQQTEALECEDLFSLGTLDNQCVGFARPDGIDQVLRFTQLRAGRCQIALQSFDVGVLAALRLHAGS